MLEYPQVLKLSPSDTAYGKYTHKVVVGWACLVARGGANTSVTLQLLPGQTPTQFNGDSGGTAPSGTNPVGTTISDCGLRIITNFDGGATSDLSVVLGDGNDTDRLLTATIIHEDATEVPAKAMGAVTIPYAYPITDTIDAVFTATGANLDALTSGEVEFYFHLSLPPTRA